MKLHTAILAWLFFGAIGTLAAVLVVLNLVRGEYLTAVVALGGCAFCYGLIFPLAKVVRGKQAPNVEVDDAGTTFRPDRGIDIPVRISLLGLVVASALIFGTGAVREAGHSGAALHAFVASFHERGDCLDRRTTAVAAHASGQH